MSATKIPPRSSQRLRALFKNGVRTRVNNVCSFGPRPLPLSWPAGTCPCGFINFNASQGVTVNAIAREIAMPKLELIGIGLMYGPIKPDTKAIGSKAAITVRVAKIVGPPTSSTTIASSTRMPMEKINAKSDAIEREAPGPGGKQRSCQRQNNGGAHNHS